MKTYGIQDVVFRIVRERFMGVFTISEEYVLIGSLNIDPV
jgi:hypothetical protein